MSPPLHCDTLCRSAAGQPFCRAGPVLSRLGVAAPDFRRLQPVALSSDEAQPLCRSRFSIDSSATSATTRSRAKGQRLTQARPDSSSCCATSSRSCGRSGSPDAAIDEHGYVMATIPATTRQERRADDRLHRARRHVAGDDRRRREADRAPRLRRPRPRPAGRSRRRCCAWPTSPYLARVHRPRHRHRVGHDAARRRQQGRRRRDRDRGRVPDGASRDPARRRSGSRSRRTRKSAAGTKHFDVARVRRALRLHDGRRRARRARVRELLGRRDDGHVPRASTRIPATRRAGW